MAQIDIQGLFKDVLPNEAIADKAEGLRQAELLGTLGGMAAYYGPQRERQLRRAAGGMFGVDLRSEAEKAREELQKLGRPQTPQEHQQYANILDRVQAGAGVQYMIGIAQEARAQQEVDARTKQAEASMISAQSQSGLGPYRAQDGRTYNTQTGMWSDLGEGDVLSTFEIEKLDPDNHDLRSWARFEERKRNAKTPQEMSDAAKVLLPRAEAGYEFVPAEGQLNEYGDQKYVLKPIQGSADYRTVMQEVDAANAAGARQEALSSNVIEITDQMLEKLDDDDITTGFFGLLQSKFIGTDEYVFVSDIETLRGNMGYDGLIQAKKASENGASGFGQLTQMELQLLEDLLTQIEIGLPKDVLRERIAKIQEAFTKSRDSAQTNWTIDKWLGIEAPPEQEEEEMGVPEGVPANANFVRTAEDYNSLPDGAEFYQLDGDGNVVRRIKG